MTRGTTVQCLELKKLDSSMFICLFVYLKKLKFVFLLKKKLFLRSILEIEMACNLFSMKYIVDDWH